MDYQKHYDVLHEMRCNLIRLQQIADRPQTAEVANTVLERIRETLAELPVLRNPEHYFKNIEPSAKVELVLNARTTMLTRFMDVARREFHLEPR